MRNNIETRTQSCSNFQRTPTRSTACRAYNRLVYAAAGKSAIASGTVASRTNTEPGLFLHSEVNSHPQILRTMRPILRQSLIGPRAVANGIMPMHYVMSTIAFLLVGRHEDMQIVNVWPNVFMSSSRRKNFDVSTDISATYPVCALGTQHNDNLFPPSQPRKAYQKSPHTPARGHTRHWVLCFYRCRSHAARRGHTVGFVAAGAVG
jgi:hypothetical protein